MGFLRGSKAHILGSRASQSSLTPRDVHSSTKKRHKAFQRLAQRPWSESQMLSDNPIVLAVLNIKAEQSFMCRKSLFLFKTNHESKYSFVLISQREVETVWKYHD